MRNDGKMTTWARTLELRNQPEILIRIPKVKETLLHLEKFPTRCKCSIFSRSKLLQYRKDYSNEKDFGLKRSRRCMKKLE